MKFGEEYRDVILSWEGMFMVVVVCAGRFVRVGRTLYNISGLRLGRGIERNSSMIVGVGINLFE